MNRVKIFKLWVGLGQIAMVVSIVGTLIHLMIAYSILPPEGPVFKQAVLGGIICWVLAILWAVIVEYASYVLEQLDTGE